MTAVPVAMISPGADSLDRMGILRSWKFSSWLRRWARWREQPWENWKGKTQFINPPSCALVPPSLAWRDALPAGLRSSLFQRMLLPALHYLTVYPLPVACLRWGLQQLPGPPFVKGDDGAHVLLAEGAVDQGGDVDTPHAFDTMEICKGLVGKIPVRECKGEVSESQPPWSGEWENVKPGDWGNALIKHYNDYV